MTNTRTDKRIAYAIESIDIAHKILAGKTLPAQITAAIRRDDQSARTDGYPTSHGRPGTGGGAQSVPTDDPNERGTVVLTAVEAAAYRFLASGQLKDEVHLLVSRLETACKRLANDARSIEDILRALPTQAPPAPQECEHCKTEAGDRYTDVDGALAIARFLCSPCIAFVELHAAAIKGAPSYGGTPMRPRLPNPAELEARRQGKRPKAKAS
jgi:hypothetical protein